NTSNCCSSFPRMPSSYQVVLWKQESFVVLRPLHIEFFRNLLGGSGTTVAPYGPLWRGFEPRRKRVE
ncbi:MAG: hypothetical protein WBQ19_16200, partial [Terriglobales bacterium]